MRLTTFRYRIKDATTGKHLQKMAESVNYVWNYCNEVNFERWNKFRKHYTQYELQKKTAGCTKLLGLQSTSIQSTCEIYSNACVQYKKSKLAWRSSKRSLGWVPFRASAIDVKGNSIRYLNKHFKIWLTRPITGKIKNGSFTQNSKGQWFICICTEVDDVIKTTSAGEIGIDFGLKTIATLSDGSELNRVNITAKYEKSLATAQRANKSKRIKSIHYKIRNVRKDWNHKQTTKLVNSNNLIVVGNVSSSWLKTTRMAKSVTDAGWHSFKTMLEYKANALGVVFKEVNESFSTVTCSCCNSMTGPKGKAGLKVRNWICEACGASHKRDVNAAINILNSFRMGHYTQSMESDIMSEGAKRSSSCNKKQTTI